MKWVVTFAGSRDHYQVPIALAEAGRLEAFVTDFYSPLNRPVWRSAPSWMQRRLARRYAEGLPSQLVQRTWSAVIANQLRGGHPGDHILGKYAGKRAREHGAALLSYSYYGFHAFRAFAGERRPKVLFQVHPHPASVRRLLSEELEHGSGSKESLLAEHELRLSKERYEQLAQESLMADYCIVASQYTRRTLLENGVSPDRVFVMPYGIDVEADSLPAPRPSNLFRVLFVGQKIHRKGLSYLLEAWSRLKLPNAELVVAGRGNQDRELLRQYAGTFRDVHNASQADLDALYRQADLFCMPSLVEGFGLVYLEALARGLPIMGTLNTGAADLITHGQEGFIVPVRDSEAIARHLEWSYRHRATLRDMRVAAFALAKQHSWQRFRHTCIQLISRIESTWIEGVAEPDRSSKTCCGRVAELGVC